MRPIEASHERLPQPQRPALKAASAPYPGHVSTSARAELSAGCGDASDVISTFSQREQRLESRVLAAQVIPMLAGDATDQTPPDLPSFLFKERIIYLVSPPGTAKGWFPRRAWRRQGRVGRAGLARLT